MRIEIGVALLASTALHAGLLLLAPVPVASRESAAPVDAPPRVVIARLKNTFAPDEPAPSGEMNSARDAPSPAAQQVVARPAPSADVLKPEPRVDNPLRFYPPEAVASGLEGETILMLRLGDDGALIDAQIAKSSGHAILDEAALRAIRAAPRFASGPGEMLFPVTFALQ